MRFKLIASVLSLVVFILVSEGMLRLLDIDLYSKSKTFPLNRDIDFPEIYQKDADLFWRFRPDFDTKSEQFSYLSYHINSTGMRGEDVADKGDAYRILALGNSCTFGWGIEYGSTYCCQLQKILSAKYPSKKIEVINAGVPGYSSHQGKIYFANELLALKPDMVLIMFGWNDQWPAGKGICDDDQRMPSAFVLGLQNLASRTKLYQLARKVAISLADRGEAPMLDDISGMQRVSPDCFCNNLKEIVKTAKAHNIKPVLLIPPVACLKNYFTGSISDFHRRHARYQAEIKRAAEYTFTDYIDLQEAFDAYRDLFDDAQADPVHFNRQGHLITANAIAEKVLPILQTDSASVFSGLSDAPCYGCMVASVFMQ